MPQLVAAPASAGARTGRGSRRRNRAGSRRSPCAAAARDCARSVGRRRGGRQRPGDGRAPTRRNFSRIRGRPGGSARGTAAGPPNSVASANHRVASERSQSTCHASNSCPVTCRLRRLCLVWTTTRRRDAAAAGSRRRATRHGSRSPGSLRRAFGDRATSTSAAAGRRRPGGLRRWTLELGRASWARGPRRRGRSSPGLPGRVRAVRRRVLRAVRRRLPRRRLGAPVITRPIAVVGPTATGKSDLAVALARAARRRDRQRRLDAALPRHGHRHREADRRPSGAACRTTCSTSATSPSPRRSPSTSGWPAPRSTTAAPRPRCRSSSAAPGCTCGRCSTSSTFPGTDPASGRGSRPSWPSGGPAALHARLRRARPGRRGGDPADATAAASCARSRSSS